MELRSGGITLHQFIAVDDPLIVPAITVTGVNFDGATAPRKGHSDHECVVVDGNGTTRCGADQGVGERLNHVTEFPGLSRWTRIAEGVCVNQLTSR